MFERPSSQNELIGAQLLKQAEQKSDLVQKKYRLDMMPFIELYTKGQVEADYRDVLAKLKTHEGAGTSSEKLGKVFESAFLDSANNHDWLGEKSEVVKASLFDDFHGVDMIATFAEKDSGSKNLIIGSDLTFSRNSVGKKFEKTVSSITRGHLAVVKYFHSDLENFTGRKTNVPRTICGLDKNNLPEMIRKWVHNPEDPLEEYRSILVHQLCAQATAFRDYAEKQHGRNHKAYEAYDNISDVFSDLKRAAIPYSELPEDTISTSLSEALSSL